MSAYSFDQDRIETNMELQEPLPERPINSDFLTLLTATKLDVWRKAYLFSNQIGMYRLSKHRSLTTTELLTIILNLAHLMTIDITPTTTKAAKSFGACLKHRLQNSPLLWQSVIEPLLSYPSVYPPGSMVKLDNFKIVFVLSIGELGLIVRDTQTTASQPETIQPSQIIAAYGAKKVVNISIHRFWWDKKWQDYQLITPNILVPFTNAYRLDRPPEILLSIQEHLNKQDININDLADIINSEKALVGYVTNAATQTSRKKLRVNDIKHALMMHGYERTNHLLIQHSLLLRLNQNYFPLQEQFMQFSSLRSLIAKKLCLQDSMLAEKAATLACFASTGLYTCGSLKNRMVWQPQTKKTYCIGALFEAELAKPLFENPISLAKAWQQEPHIIRALRSASSLPDNISANRQTVKLATIIGLSLILSRKVFFAENELCPQTKLYIKQSLNKLSLDDIELDAIQKQAAFDCHVNCSLNSSLRINH